MRQTFSSTVVIAAIAALVIASTAQRSLGAEFSPQKDLDNSSQRLQVTLTVPAAKVRRGDRLNIELRYDCGLSCTLYNPYFDGLTVGPGQIAIFDSNKRYLGDLTARSFGSYRGPTPHNWVNVDAGGFVGMKLGFPAGIVPLSKWQAYGNELPPGKYFLQAIFNGHLTSMYPGNGYTLTNEQMNAWTIENREYDICRSNVVAIELE